MFTINGHRLHGWHEGKDPLQEEWERLRANADNSFMDNLAYSQFEDLYYDIVRDLDDNHYNEILNHLMYLFYPREESIDIIRQNNLMDLTAVELKDFYSNLGLNYDVLI